jgi:hypothetical protein
MNRSTLRTIGIGAALAVLGWGAGRAQRATPEFELLVNAPPGETIVECVRGCTLQWAERGINPNDTPVAKFTYSCTAGRCTSGRVAGWIVKP